MRHVLVVSVAELLFVALDRGKGEILGSVQHTPAIQAVKALCSRLHNVESVELCNAINRFSTACEAVRIFFSCLSSP